LPLDLREAAGPDFATFTFASLYLLDDEWAAEIVNRTVHGVMHIGWVPVGTGVNHQELTLTGTGESSAVCTTART